MRPMDSAFKRQMAPPLSLLVLGALTPSHHRVTISDENIEKVNFRDHPDLVGITVKADTAFRAREIAQSYRKKGIPVVYGGIYPTTCPEENADHADACVMGEAEGIWEEILHNAESGRLKKIYQSASPPDLSTTPVPRWDLIAGKRYLYTNTLTIGRGCPWKCSFCYNSSPKLPTGYRMKPIRGILREIESLRTRHVMFIDDNFIANPSFARKLLNVLQPLGLTWHTAVSADVIKHDGMIDRMAESGCRSLYIGFESLNPNSLHEADKKQNRIDEYERTVSAIHRCGMMVNASVVFGFDEDGPGVFDHTTDWLIGQKIETMTAHILTPYPGTKLHAKLLSEKRIIDFDLTHYNTSRVVFRPAGMTAEELYQGYLTSYRRFYSWKNISRRMPLGTSRCKPYLLFNLGYRKLGGFLSSLGVVGFMRFLGKLGARLSYPDMGL